MAVRRSGPSGSCCAASTKPESSCANSFSPLNFARSFIVGPAPEPPDRENLTLVRIAALDLRQRDHLKRTAHTAVGELHIRPAERDGAFDTGAESSLCLPECSGIEIRDAAVNAEDDGLAIDDKNAFAGSSAQPQDPGEALCPIVSASGNQPHPITVALHAQAVAIVLDLVDPVGPVRHGGPARRETELERKGHVEKIGGALENANPAPKMAPARGSTEHGQVHSDRSLVCFS
jgi:hypothetical protein